MNILNNFKFEYIEQPPYSTDLSLSDNFWFPNLKEFEWEDLFEYILQIIATEQYFSDQT